MENRILNSELPDADGHRQALRAELLAKMEVIRRVAEERDRLLAENARMREAQQAEVAALKAQLAEARKDGERLEGALRKTWEAVISYDHMAWWPHASKYSTLLQEAREVSLAALGRAAIDAARRKIES